MGEPSFLSDCVWLRCFLQRGKGRNSFPWAEYSWGTKTLLPLGYLELCSVVKSTSCMCLYGIEFSSLAQPLLTCDLCHQ